MADFFTRLASRTLQNAPTAEPLLSPPFAAEVGGFPAAEAAENVPGSQEAMRNESQIGSSVQAQRSLPSPPQLVAQDTSIRVIRPQVPVEPVVAEGKEMKLDDSVSEKGMASSKRDQTETPGLHMDPDPAEKAVILPLDLEARPASLTEPEQETTSQNFRALQSGLLEPAAKGEQNLEIQPAPRSELILPGGALVPDPADFPDRAESPPVEPRSESPSLLAGSEMEPDKTNARHPQVPDIRPILPHSLEEGPAAEERREPSGSPTVRVTIGRIEIRAAAPPAPPAAPLRSKPRKPNLNLNDYLKNRSESNR